MRTQKETDLEVEVERLTARIAELEGALAPFAAVHGRASPSLSLTMHDLRMAHEALKDTEVEA